MYTAQLLCHFSRLVSLNRHKNCRILCVLAAILNLAAILDLGPNQNELLITMSLEYKDLALCQFSKLFLKLNNGLVLFPQSAALCLGKPTKQISEMNQMLLQTIAIYEHIVKVDHTISMPYSSSSEKEQGSFSCQKA